jgi:hypothetical protein
MSRISPGLYVTQEDGGIPFPTDAGVGATAAELNRTADASARVILKTTTAALSLTEATHANRIVVLNAVFTAAQTITLPAATGTGNVYTIINNAIQTANGITVTALAGDVLTASRSTVFSATTTDHDNFISAGTHVLYKWNVTTTGGLGGDKLVATDLATDSWLFEVESSGSGTLATGFA